MRTVVWWRGRSEIRCCSSAEGLEPGDRLEPQGADEMGKKTKNQCLTRVINVTNILRATFLSLEIKRLLNLCTCVC